MTDIQKLNFSVSVTQSILNFEISVSCTECNQIIALICCLPVIMPQMTIFECQKDKNMTRVKNKVINVKVVLEFIS
jgi:hypothetical protein